MLLRSHPVSPYPYNDSDPVRKHSVASHDVLYLHTVFDKSIRRLEPPSRFLAISPKRMHISTPNFERRLSQQFHTLCKNLKVQDVIGRPQIASEWHHIPSISTPPRTQFLSYDQLAYMTFRRICRGIEQLSWIFKIFENLKIQKNHFFFFKNFPLKHSPKPEDILKGQSQLSISLELR